MRPIRPSVNSESGLARSQVVALRLTATQLLSEFASVQTPGAIVGGNLAIDAGLRGLVPRGWRGTGRKIVTGLARAGRVAARQQQQFRVDGVVSQARTLMATLSVADRTLKDSPNSAKLLTRFGTKLDRGAPVVRLRALIGALDFVGALSLVTNQEVRSLHERRLFEKARGSAIRTAPELAQLVRSIQAPQSAEYYEARLNPFRVSAEISDALDGALARLRQGGPDAYRQGAASLRVAFEALLKELTGERDWKEAIDKLVRPGEERGIVVRLHRLLSASSHAGHQTTKEELELVLDLFATLGALLTSLRSAATRETGAPG